MISVIIPTYNPNLFRLNQTLQGLQSQSLATTLWELIIIDNNSTTNFKNKLDLSWHHTAKIVKEENQGLTYARLKGFEEAKGEFIVMVDDDNILDQNYLLYCQQIFEQNPMLGGIGGKSIPLFESTPPEWLIHFYGSLALRDLGDEIQWSSWQNQYPACAPIGAGMAIRKEALAHYISKLKKGFDQITDRKGDSLASGGDNDLILEVLKSDWQVGYFPMLSLRHIIPENRTSKKYLAKLVYETNISWIQLLEAHRINPWKPISKLSLPFRMARSYWNTKAWKNTVSFLTWRGNCGLFVGLSKL